MDGFWPTFARRDYRPSGYSDAAAEKRSFRMAIPDEVIMPIQDTPDDSFELFVVQGDKVKAGQKIAILGKPPEYIAVHASISGEVTATITMLHPLGYNVHSVRIRSGEKQEVADSKPFIKSGLTDVAVFLREMGIPLDYNCFRNVATVLVNATEFEPLITSKEILLLEEKEKVFEGLKVLLMASGAQKAVFVVEKADAALSSVLSDACMKVPEAEIQEVNRPFPDTIQELIRQKNIFEKHMSKQGSIAEAAMVIEPDMIAAVYDAYVLGIPYVNQLVSVMGSGIKNPQNLWVKTGTPLINIIQHAGGSVESLGRVAFGGPLMGIPQFILKVPVIKRTRAVYAAVAIMFDEDRRSRFYKRSPCIRCGKCVDVCPACIQPGLISEMIEHKKFYEAEELGLLSCLECGLCYYVCPSMIPIIDLIKLGKVNFNGKGTLLSLNSYKTLLG